MLLPHCRQARRRSPVAVMGWPPGLRRRPSPSHPRHHLPREARPRFAAYPGCSLAGGAMEARASHSSDFERIALTAHTAALWANDSAVHSHSTRGHPPSFCAISIQSRRRPVGTAVTPKAAPGGPMQSGGTPAGGVIGRLGCGLAGGERALSQDASTRHTFRDYNAAYMADARTSPWKDPRAPYRRGTR